MSRSFLLGVLLLGSSLALAGCPETDDDDATADDDDVAGDDDDASGDDDDSTSDDDDSAPVDGDGDGDPADTDCDDSDPAVETLDADGDGVTTCDGDCDDADPANSPGNEEICDGRDNDCNGEPSGDEVDDDGDGQTECDGDCDDEDEQNFDGNPEQCDGQDNDCDGAPSPLETDDDGDGQTECLGDCDDADPANFPFNPEVCDGQDNDCDEVADFDDAGEVDADGDGALSCADCDDADAANFPGGGEVCDGADNDCDGVPGGDEIDDDGDGQTECDGDCDDGDAANFGGNPEACDGADNDCNGLPDADADGEVDGDGDGDLSCADCDDADAALNEADADGDGNTTCAGDCDDGDATVEALDADGDGNTTCAGDCDDGDATVDETDDDGDGQTECDGDCDDADDANFDGNAEVCDGADNDCDAAVPATEIDDDGDGQAECEGDCDDGDSANFDGNLEVCDGGDNDCDTVADPAGAWWDAGWPYRIPVSITSSSYDVIGAPIVVEVDFRAALDSLGDPSAFDPSTLVAVPLDCALEPLETQFLDAWAGIFDKADDVDPAGDEYGSVAFLYDTDGDYGTPDTLAAASTFDVALYFGGASTASTANTVTASAPTDQLDSGAAVATFSPSSGGLLDTLVTGASPSLMSQTSSCCGNSIYTTNWGIDPQDAAGTLEVLEDGPVFAAVEAYGSRADGNGAYDYSYVYWVFAGHPAVYSKVVQTTTADTTNFHSGDGVDGIRPWESRQDSVSGGGAVFEMDTTSYAWADTSNAGVGWGVSWAFVQPPAFSHTIANYNPYLITFGNDYLSSGGVPMTVPAGTSYFDHIVQLVYPHEGAWADVEATVFGLVEGVTTSQDAAEGQ